MPDLVMLPGGRIQFGQYIVSRHVLDRFLERGDGAELSSIFDAIKGAGLVEYDVHNPDKEYALKSGNLIFICKIARGMHLIKTVVYDTLDKHKKKRGKKK